MRVQVLGLTTMGKHADHAMKWHENGVSYSPLRDHGYFMTCLSLVVVKQHDHGMVIMEYTMIIPW